MNKLMTLTVATVATLVAFAQSQKITVTVENEAPPPPAQVRRVALVVQNHCSGNVQLPLSVLADTMTARLSGHGFAVVNPANAIGVCQNRSQHGEAMPEASATELARMLNAEGVVTVAVQEFTSESIGNPPVAYRLKARVTASLAEGATGAAVCGVTVTARSPQYTVAKVKEDNAALYEDMLHSAAESCADQLKQKAAAANWKPGNAGLARVNFTCNIQGADVKIDGVAMGTLPAMVNVPQGVHNLLVEYPFCVPYSTKALFTDGQTYNVVLQLDAAGRERFKSETLFAETVDRIRKTGATDDYVRRTIADGTSQYWKNSGVKIDHGEVKDLKLDPPGGNDSVAPRSPTVDELMEKARGM